MIVLFVILDILIFSLVIIAVFFLVRKIMEIREKEKPMRSCMRKAGKR